MPRTTPPVACTTADRVYEAGVLPTMSQAAAARQDIRTIVETAAMNPSPAIRRNLTVLLRSAQQRLADAELTLSLVAPAAEALRVAEAARNWDRLGLHAIKSGREQAGELIPLLEAVRDAQDGSPEHSRARQALVSWFEVHGDALVRPVVLTEVGRKRAPTLLHEYGLWRNTNTGATT